MKKILFLHGFFASGSCLLAHTLISSLEGKAEVLAPDLPRNPSEALIFICKLCEKEKPDLLVGNSCGGFYAQILAPILGIPALLGNPHFKMTEFLKERVGTFEYKYPRKDGKQQLVIDNALIEKFKNAESVQFDYCSPYYRDRVWGLFGERDTLAKYESVFREYYNNAFHFPGGHTPTPDEVRTWYVPIIEKMLLMYKKPEKGIRYFQHFKGGVYRMLHTAYDSETNERMVVYQALYGDCEYWVRPEKMFFEQISREGKRFPRFVEIERP